MIIKLTVNDNDFQDTMKEFLREFYMRVLELSLDSRIDEGDVEAIREWRNREKKLREILNPNTSEEISEEDKEYLIAQIHKVFGHLVDNRHPDNSEYLKENLEVSIIESCTDKWENGEVFYWFQHSGAILCQ